MLCRNTIVLALGTGVAGANVVAAPPATLRMVTSGLQAPVDIAALPGDAGHILVLEQSGRIRVVNTQTGVVRATPYLDFSAAVCCDPGGGALGMALSPGYASNGELFVQYTDGVTAASTVMRYRVTADPYTADAGSAELVLRYPRAFSGHNGGWLGFHPLDGTLFISGGDSGDFFFMDPDNASQTLTNEKRGKMLRIDPGADAFPADPERNYTIPADNPLVGLPGDDEIWSCGFRNPWRCAFDAATGDLYMADVGHDYREEINFEPAGAPVFRNYGWRCMEGSLCTGLTGCECNGTALTLPVFEIEHTNAPCDSITGGVVYRGASVPAYQGRYFFADFCRDRVWSLRMVSGAPTDVREHTAEFLTGAGVTPASIVTFGTDGAGEMYLADYSNGRVFAMVPRCLSDFDGNTFVNGQDFDAFVDLFVLGDPGADIDGNTFVNGEDFDTFVEAFEAGC